MQAVKSPQPPPPNPHRVAIPPTTSGQFSSFQFLARHYGIANTICISQPDSKLPAREITEFPVINLFDELPELP